MVAPSSPWSAAQQQLESLLAQFDTARVAAQHSSRSPTQADGYAAQCRELAQQVAQAYPVLARALMQGQPPAEVVTLFQHIKRQLEHLRDTTARLAAGPDRALGILFPHQHNGTYAQLGGRGGMGSRRWPSQAPLKA